MLCLPPLPEGLVILRAPKPLPVLEEVQVHRELDRVEARANPYAEVRVVGGYLRGPVRPI